MIHTTHKKAIKAYGAMNNILKLVIPADDARKITMMRMDIDKEAQFNDQEIHKLLSHYNSETTKDGRYKFKTAEDRDAFEQKVDEMNSIEFDIDQDPVVISLGRYSHDDIMISQADIAALEGFIEFTE